MFFITIINFNNMYVKCYGGCAGRASYKSLEKMYLVRSNDNSMDFYIGLLMKNEHDEQYTLKVLMPLTNGYYIGDITTLNREQFMTQCQEYTGDIVYMAN